ncbi:MAG: hypothetical protein ACPHRF_02540, partial [Porticoccaceae bacterium]
AAVSVKVVKSSDEAINHINKYGTMHTDSIITNNKSTANKSHHIGAYLQDAHHLGAKLFLNSIIIGRVVIMPL